MRSTAAETTASTSGAYVPVDFSEDDQVILCEQASVSGPFVALMYFWPAVSPTRRQPHLVGRIEMPPIPQPRDGGATPERGSRRG
jgi:hypothetical protein